MSFFILSCTNSPRNGGYIDSIRNKCASKTGNCPNCLHTMDNGGNFWDSCGKFKVGDKVIFKPE